MNHSLKRNQINSEIYDFFDESDDTIYFDNNGNLFKITNNDGIEVKLSLDRLIDIL